MEISDGYLAKVRISVRRNSSETVDSELKDIISHCRMDLISKGVPKEIVQDEKDPRVLGCQRAFARWHFGIGGDDAERNREDYRLMADELRKNVV